MNINSVQGMNAYTANALMADTASVQNNNKDATNVELDKEPIQPVQEAFQVNITQEALALQAENAEDIAREDQEQQLTQQIQQAQLPQQFQGQPGGQLDIIA